MTRLLATALTALTLAGLWVLANRGPVWLLTILDDEPDPEGDPSCPAQR